MDDLDSRTTKQGDYLMSSMEKEHFTVKEAAAELGKTAYTVREWCRFGRIKAEVLQGPVKRDDKFLIHRDEISRYRRDGLRPPPSPDEPDAVDKDENPQDGLDEK